MSFFIADCKTVDPSYCLLLASRHICELFSDPIILLLRSKQYKRMGTANYNFLEKTCVHSLLFGLAKRS